jgi:hypothetical protein
MTDLSLPVLTSAIGSIIGSSTGVFIGFWLNRRNLVKQNQERVNVYLKALTNEISEAMASLQKRILQLMSDDLWQSVVNSGDVVLFPYAPREDLRVAYFAIRKCNYEFTRARDLGEKFRAEADTLEKRAQIGQAWHATSNQAYSMSDSTLDYLQRISKKEWFKKASDYEPK